MEPRVRRVTLDADRHLTVRFSHRLPVADWTPEKFKVHTSSGKALPARAVYPFRHRGDRCALYSIELDVPFDWPRTAYALEVEGFGTHNAQMGFLAKDINRFYDAEAILGALYSPQHTTFRVFVPGAIRVRVVIADEPGGNVGLHEHEMIVDDHGIWSVIVPGDLHGKFYAYKFSGFDFDPDAEITDIYAVCTQARNARAMLVDLRRTDPPGFREHQPPALDSIVDAIIYEMHVRDFTIAADSGVVHKGKYAGLNEPGTHLVDDPTVATGLDHLSELGVTHVQIMPVHDFDNDETPDDPYNWGYMPVHFNSPDGWYASTASGCEKIRELKTAIRTLHDRGVGVILDVVYNHTAPPATFEKTVPNYYYRLTDAGNFSNGSGCGNEIDSQSPMARKFIIDSVLYWANEYLVDGFRFDLMGLIDIETLAELRRRLDEIRPGILLYGEPWTGGHTPLKPVTSKHIIRGSGIAAFNDTFRDVIKGDPDGNEPGFLQLGYHRGGVEQGLRGSVDDWAQDPTDSINYFAAHDNLTAADKLAKSAPDVPEEIRKLMLRFGALILFTAQGCPFIHSGQEMCRTKQGCHNSYNQPDDINRIDWSWKKMHADNVQYFAGLIALRKAHPVFRLRTTDQVHRRLAFQHAPNPCAVVCHIDASEMDEDSAERIILLLNGAVYDAEFELPEGDWPVYADTDRAGLEPLRTISGPVTLHPHTGLLLIR